MLYLHLAPLTARRKDEDKALLGDEERRLAHECVHSRVCGLSPRGASRPGLNRPAKDGEAQVMVIQVLVVEN